MVQLRTKLADLEKLGYRIVCVMREDKLEAKGLAKVQKRLKEDKIVLLSDLGKKTTESYSPKGFATYLLDKDQRIRAIMPGKKFDRPTGEEILQKAKELHGK